MKPESATVLMHRDEIWWADLAASERSEPEFR